MFVKRLISAAGLAVLMCGAGYGADAKFLQVKGPVTVRTGGAERSHAAKKGDPLYFWDEIRTGAGGLAHVSFANGATLLVKENSVLTLRGDKKKTQVSFSVGEFLIGLRKKLGPDSKFTIRTPAAAASVRGTLFWGLSEANKDTTYACFESAIEIEAGGKTLLLEAGQKTKIPYGQAPTAPEPANVPLSYLDTFAVDGSIQGLDELIKK